MNREVLRTPLGVIYRVGTFAAQTAERLMGDRSDSPLLVCIAAVEGLKRYDIRSRVLYGDAAWIEILENQEPLWVGAWNKSSHFWVETEYGEVVDLSLGASHRKRPHSNQEARAKYSPPNLWSHDVPQFIKYRPQGIAEMEPKTDRDTRWFEIIRSEAKVLPLEVTENEGGWINEPLIISGKKLLDSSDQVFAHYDRALRVKGLPKSPF